MLHRSSKLLPYFVLQLPIYCQLYLVQICTTDQSSYANGNYRKDLQNYVLWALWLVNHIFVFSHTWTVAFNSLSWDCSCYQKKPGSTILLLHEFFHDSRKTMPYAFQVWLYQLQHWGQVTHPEEVLPPHQQWHPMVSQDAVAQTWNQLCLLPLHLMNMKCRRK